MTVKVDIKHVCGCGFSTRDIDRAVTHCNGTGHSMSVYGTISPETPGATKPTKTRTVVDDKAAVKVFKSPGEFEGLRNKLKTEGG